MEFGHRTITTRLGGVKRRRNRDFRKLMGVSFVAKPTNFHEAIQFATVQPFGPVPLTAGCLARPKHSNGTN